MAYVNDTTFAFSPMPGAVKSAWNGLKTWYEATLVRNELMSMSDRELADIGVDRANINHFAMQAAKKW